MVTRADLPPGTQACQAIHAACDFAVAHPRIFAEWQRDSNTMVLLAVRDELDLQRLRSDAVVAGRRSVAFHEPDLGDALTALALEPAAHRLVRHLPLALVPGPPHGPQCPQGMDPPFTGRRGVKP